jgi:pimeloyl-ACP methyl ester carboxylesterase
MVVPGLLSTDIHLAILRSWLGRIGYRPFRSGIGINADCPDLLVRTIAEKIHDGCCVTGRKVHLIGHSLGGLLVRVLACRYPHLIRSAITLASPFRGFAAHPAALYLVEKVGLSIRLGRGGLVSPMCYTPRCRCGFIQTLERELPASVAQAALYSRSDGIVDWRLCKTGNPADDFEVPSTHTGMIANPIVYEVVAHCLARAVSGTLTDNRCL